MTDELNEESRRDEADYLSFMPGQRLQKARELRGLSVDQVARELRLSARYVQAMEADAYKELPEPAFVRGYMRRYAQLVKLSPDDIAGKFDQCYAADQETPPPDARPVNPIQLLGEIAKPRRWKKLLPWLSLVLIVVLLLGFLWNGLANRKAPVVEAEPVAAPAAVESVPAPVAEAVAPAAAPVPVTTAPVATATTAAATTTTSSVMNVLPQPSAPSALPAPASTAAAAPVPAASTGPDSLVITLSAESWVSVRDANQPLVGSGNKPAGQISLRGKAPFYVNIGNAPAATLTVNGKAVDLKPHTQGAVANLTVKP